MKPDVPNTQPSQSFSKWDFVVYFVTMFGSVQLMSLLCDMELHRTVLLSASMISIGNAIYYGIVWKDLRKSFRLGLAIFFSIIASIGFVLYELFLRADKLLQSNLPVELFGGFVLILTIIFTYKHRTPSFWNWV